MKKKNPLRDNTHFKQYFSLSSSSSAEENNNRKLKDLEAKKAAINLKSLEAKNEALLRAWDDKCPEIIDFLLNNGAEQNIKRPGEVRSPIFTLDVASLKAILPNLSDQNRLKLINSRDANGETPLFVAIKEQEIEVSLITTYLQYGADPQLPNRYNKSPLKYAEEKEFIAIVKLLENPPTKTEAISEPLEIKKSTSISLFSTPKSSPISVTKSPNHKLSIDTEGVDKIGESLFATPESRNVTRCNSSSEIGCKLKRSSDMKINSNHNSPTVLDSLLALSQDKVDNSSSEDNSTTDDEFVNWDKVDLTGGGAYEMFQMD